MPILLEVVHRTFGRVHRDIREIRPAETFNLRIEIREVTPLQQRIIRVVYAAYDVVRTERDLLRLQEEVVYQLVEDKTTYALNREFFFRDNLGRIQNIK